MSRADYNVIDELHKTVVTSLATSFGLDFMLLEDKHGGNVDTVHNARQNIYANQSEKIKYDTQDDYDSAEYHRHKNYIDRNRTAKDHKQQGKQKDAYTGKLFGKKDKMNLDHVVSAKEVHDDRGRVLAGLSGADLANRDSNLVHTNENLNKSKKAKTMTDFVKGDLQSNYSERSSEINALKQKGNLTVKEQKHLDRLENLNAADHSKMQEIDDKARKEYNQTINLEYYTSTKFLKSTASTTFQTGYQMGTRQAVGLLLAEVWFELKEAIPKLFLSLKNFELKDFLSDIKDAIKNIWERVKARFSKFIHEFKDGFVGGIFANISTAIMNIFVTSTKMVGKLIREVWGGLVKAVKLVFFNPEKLSRGQLLKEILKILSASVALSLGVVVNNHLTPFLVGIPFGAELSAFVGALVTGVLTIGFHYFFEYSSIMQKLWAWLDRKDAFDLTLEAFKRINAQLDDYLLELSKIELNLNVDEMDAFAVSLSETNTLLEKRMVLKAEVNRRNLDIGYEAGNLESLNKWLKNL